MPGHRSAKIEAPDAFGDAALEPPGEDGLTPAQFAARVSAKREQAAQDAGWVQPPGPDEEFVPDEPPETAEPEEAEEPPEEEEAEEGEEEEEEEEAEEGEEPGPETDFYVGRYRDRESAEEAFREKDATINRLYRELHEQRLAIEQAMQGEEQIDASAWQEWAEEAVGSGAGVRGAMDALQNGGEDGYDIYVSAWMRSEDEDERAQAVAFNNKVQRIFAEQRAAMAAQTSVEERSPTEEAQLAKQRAASLHPDFENHTETMDRLVTEPGLLPEETRQWLAGLAREGLEGKVRAWDYLYMAAAAMGQPNRAKARQVERAQRKASTDRAKVAAMVSSAEATPTRTPLTEAESKELAYRNQLRERWDLPPIEVE